jgi:hypothetical protein
MVERSALESEIIRKCLSRSELQCSFVEYRGYKVVYRRYARYEFKNKKIIQYNTIDYAISTDSQRSNHSDEKCSTIYIYHK